MEETKMRWTHNNRKGGSDCLNVMLVRLNPQ